MNKKQIEKIIAGIAVAGSIVGGTFMLSRDTQEFEVKQMRTNLVDRSERKVLTYDEYLQLIEEYNTEIKEAKEKGEKFELKNINKDFTIVDSLNAKILE